MRRRLKSYGLTYKTCVNFQFEFATTMKIAFAATMRTINLHKRNKVLGLARYLNVCKLIRRCRGMNSERIVEESVIKISYSNRN